MTRGVVMHPACSDEVAALLVRKERQRCRVCRKIREKVDYRESEICDEGEYTIVTRAVALANDKEEVRQVHEME